MSARNVRSNPDRKCSDCGIRRASHFALTIDPKSHFALGPTGTMEEAMRDPKIPRPKWCEDCALHRNEFHAQDIGKWVWDREEMRRGVPWDVFTVQAQYGTDPKLVMHPRGECSAAASMPPRVRANPDLTGAACRACGAPELIDDSVPALDDPGILRTSDKAWIDGRGQVHAAGRVLMCAACKRRNDARVVPVRPNPRRVRPNPALILVTGNPAPGTVEKSWCKFHQRDVYDGRTESFGIIRGMPPFVFALGKCKSLEIDGAARPFTPQPWLVCSPDDESLWIVTKDVMNLGSGAAGQSIEAITYDPPRESGKTPAYYRHEFDKPLPVLTPIGDPHRCRAVLLDGGAYKVTDWLHG